MKLALAASGLFLALMGLGLACGPTETFCYKEGKTCKVVEGEKMQQMMQSDAGDAAELTKHCFDDKTGMEIPCTN